MSNQNSNSQRSTSANNKMLIDATHPEETRVVVVRNGRVEEFDYESAARKLLRGNIYLAKVTRVEPSLQAAFVDYGGNRHGFLAFNEIHPDYYQIPIADRRALIEAESAAEAEEEAAADRAAEAAARRASRRRGEQRGPRHSEAEDAAVDVSSLLPPEQEGADSSDDEGEGRYDDPSAHEPDADADRGQAEPARTLAERSESDATLQSPAVEPPPYGEREPVAPADLREPGDRSDDTYRTAAPDEPAQAEPERHQGDRGDDDGSGNGGNGEVVEVPAGDEPVETVGTANGVEAEQIETVATSEDVLEEVPVRPRRRLRSYKIQEVTKRRQVMLVQVVKEERGTKGAALTTYLSLAGRYTVLMPNTARGGGISRKITNPQDRKRLKAIAAELDVPEGMGLIIRTAGAARTKQEIKRDYEYLLRLWESVRELALSSNAPALVYEEGNLIKRSIRDLYGKEVEEIIVAGDAAYHEAKDFMRMLMPSHAKNVHHYQDPEPLFTRYGMERHLNAMFSPYVHLRSGGYLVINQTEALVAIDINSGKSTREFSIEETALSTNLEAADEIARQLKLRDLAGLIVIDFIDMEEKRNNRAVERRLKDALRHDRARIQLGRISHFGLLEMSRQRMRTGVLEGSTTQCPHCQGTGIVRSTESVALAVLRGIEDALMQGQPTSLAASTTATVALYILNNKRAFIVEMENRYGITITIQASEKLQGANFTIERQARREDQPRRPERTAVNMDWGFEDEDQDGEAPLEPEEDVDDEAESTPSASSEQGAEGRRRRRRRRGRRGDREQGGLRQPHGQRPNETGRLVRADDEQPYIDDEPHGFVPNGNGEPAYEEAGSPPSFGDVEEDAEGDGDGEDSAARRAEGDEQGGERRRRRRRGRRGGRRNLERDRPTAAETGSDEVTGAPALGDSNGHLAEADVLAVHTDYSDAIASPSQLEAPPSWQPFAPEAGQTENGAAAAAASAAVQVAATSEAVGAEPAADREPVPSPALAPATAEERAVADGGALAEVPPAVVVVSPAPAVSPRTAPVASEPVLERVVVGPEVAGAAETAEAARPARRGWWQRR